MASLAFASKLSLLRNDAVGWKSLFTPRNYYFDSPNLLKLNPKLKTRCSRVGIPLATTEVVDDRIVEDVEKQPDNGRVLRVGLICGGPSAERGISLNSARSVLDHIQVPYICTDSSASWLCKCLIYFVFIFFKCVTGRWFACELLLHRLWSQCVCNILCSGLYSMSIDCIVR